ncbi:MAG: Gfo/Idh/MocA family oxidoreductase [bacterium]|nr:Gfo/Idh/MocA family oxidoreductase [bacterium]
MRSEDRIMMKGNKLPRREFLRNMLGGVAGLVGFPAVVSSRALGGNGQAPPSDRIGLGCIGVGGMGTGHVRRFLQFPDVRVAAVCDARKTYADRAKKIVDERYGDQDCHTYNDFRELIARDNVDAVLIATPEHWHALIGIEAARHGKHMYYEKPMSLTVAEAKAVREAVNRYGVVFQFGTQQRSSHDYRHTCELVRNGRIGRLETIMIGSAPSGYSPIPDQAPQPVPPGFDYDMWLGPAPWAPYCDVRVSNIWMFISDYGLGCLDGAWGIHDVDIAQWVNDCDASGPIEVEGAGKFYEDIRDAAYSWEVEHKYANGVRLIHMDLGTARSRAKEFHVRDTMASVMYGTEGWIYVSREGMQTHPESLMQTVFGPNDIRVIKSDNHQRNFLDAIKTAQPTISPVEAAAGAETVCQQAHIAMKLGRKLRWDPVREVFIDDDEANRMLSKAMRSPWHL